MHQETLFNFLSGSCAGVVRVFLGFPMDTIKVNMQTTQEGIEATISRIFQQDGIKGFYKGMKFPLLSVPILQAVSFTSFYQAKNLFSSRDLNLFQTLLCGSFAGATVSVFSCPVELAKCRLQTDKIFYNGPLDVFNKVAELEGLNQVYRGMLSTVMREVIGFGSFFLAFDLSRQYLAKKTYDKDLSILAAGGIAGAISQLLCQPYDTIKTKLQLQREVIQEKRKFKHRYYDGGILHCYSKIMRKQGFKGLWKGFTPIGIQAIYTSALSFWIFENLSNFLICEYQN